MATTSGGSVAKTSSSKLTFNPSTGTLTATTFSGAVTGTHYIGTTAIAGNAGSGTVTALAGLTSVAATTFTGALTGTATACSGTHYIGTTAIAGNAGSGTVTALAGLTSVSATTFTGALTGTASALVTSSLYQVSGIGAGVASVANEVRAAGNVTAYQTSDKRLKENIVPIGDALALVSRLSGNRYDWTQAYIDSHGGEDGYFVRKHDVGVIAQEVEAVLPEAVADRNDGYKAVNYEKLVPLLIEAIKELNAKVAVLEAKLGE
jgi:hypothetical protein